jgi:hypothetical protein
MNRRKQILFTGITILLPVVATIFIAEIGFRLAGLGNPPLYEFNLGYGYRLRPDQKITRHPGAVMTVNAAGLRSTEEWRPGAFTRVLFVGDSITYGGAAIDDTRLFSELVCKRLPAPDVFAATPE